MEHTRQMRHASHRAAAQQHSVRAMTDHGIDYYVVRFSLPTGGRAVVSSLLVAANC